MITRNYKFHHIFATLIVGILIGSLLFSKKYATLFSKEVSWDGEGDLCQKKFILLTTERSGSTWTCSLLHQQKGVSCGGKPQKKFDLPDSEILGQYSEKAKDGTIASVTWQEYQKDLDDAFAEVCQYNPEVSIGFKLMYNQIPPQFLEERKLENYLKDNGISLIHLVREAKILVLASKRDVKKRKKQYGGNLHHITNATLNKEIRENGYKINWDDALIDSMLEMEALSIQWQATVHLMAPLVRYYYISYESLLAKDERDFWVGQLVGFLTEKGHDSSISNAEGTLLQLSESDCSDRIENYAGFRAHEKVKHSRSAVACDLIATNV
uniref:Sulfotransferase domain-containing protein n=1 Tax=Ditylum brightwellii TaxID=49249 RepID=A0A7S4VYU0_9STRA